MQVSAGPPTQQRYELWWRIQRHSESVFHLRTNSISWGFEENLAKKLCTLKFYLQVYKHNKIKTCLSFEEPIIWRTCQNYLNTLNIFLVCWVSTSSLLCITLDFAVDSKSVSAFKYLSYCIWQNFFLHVSFQYNYVYSKSPFKFFQIFLSGIKWFPKVNKRLHYFTTTSVFAKINCSLQRNRCCIALLYGKLWLKHVHCPFEYKYMRHISLQTGPDPTRADSSLQLQLKQFSW